MIRALLDLTGCRGSRGRDAGKRLEAPGGVPTRATGPCNGLRWSCPGWDATDASRALKARLRRPVAARQLPKSFASITEPFDLLAEQGGLTATYAGIQPGFQFKGAGNRNGDHGLQDFDPGRIGADNLVAEVGYGRCLQGDN